MSIKRIVLSIGHGGQPGEKFDPGAVNTVTKETENTEARQITNLLAAKLVKAGMPVLLLPDYEYVRSIREVNKIYQPGDWAIEVHKDSFTAYNAATMRRRCGTYYYHKSALGARTAGIMQRSFIATGAHPTSWARPDNFSNHGGLGWNSITKPLAHIMELGFMQDSNTAADDEFYATAAFNAIMAVVQALKNE